LAKTDRKSHWLTIIIAIVLLGWGAAIGTFLAYYNYSTSPVEAVIGADPGSWDRERWSGIYQGKTKIGYSHTRLKSVDDGYRLWSNTRIKLSLLETEQDIRLNLQARLDKSYILQEVDFEALSGFMELSAHGRREGGFMVFSISSGDDTFEKRLPMDRPVTVEMEWALEERLSGAKPGDEFTLYVFEPMTQKNLPVRVKVVGEEAARMGELSTPAYKLEVEFGGQTEWAWVSKKTGRILREYHPDTGFTTVLEPREKALDVDWDKAGELDILTALMVPSNTALPDPRSLKYMLARLRGADLSGLDLALPGRQSMSGDTVEVRTENLPASSYPIPITESLPDKARQYGQWLAPTPFIQSDHARIRRAAKDAAGGAEDAVSAVDSILGWMGRRIIPSYVVSVPSALEVLEKGKGACKEHTVLFIAMARSLGIPARTVSGIVYSDRMMLDGFYYHSWAEVYLGDGSGHGRWVTVDPTFGQFPADATHVRLIEGELDRMIELLGVVGKLEVEVEDYH